MESLFISFTSDVENQPFKFQEFIDTANLNMDYKIKPVEMQTEINDMGLGALTGR